MKTSIIFGILLIILVSMAWADEHKITLTLEQEQDLRYVIQKMNQDRLERPRAIILPEVNADQLLLRVLSEYLSNITKHYRDKEVDSLGLHNQWHKMHPEKREKIKEMLK